MSDGLEAGCLKLANNWDGASELLVDGKSKNTHHGGTAVVELDGTLRELGLLIEGVPAEVDGAVTEVTHEVSGGGAVGTVLHDGELQETNEGEDLEGTGNGDLEGSGPALSDGGEAGSGEVNVTGKADSGTGGDLAQEGELADAAVLELDVTEAVEALLVGSVEHTKGIEESERGLGAELVLEGAEAGGGLGDRGGGESGGGADEGGNDGGLHGC